MILAIAGGLSAVIYIIFAFIYHIFTHAVDPISGLTLIILIGLMGVVAIHAALGAFLGIIAQVIIKLVNSTRKLPQDLN